MIFKTCVMLHQQKALFNSKTTQKLISSIELSSTQKDAAFEWLKLLEKNQLEDEKSNYLKFASIILEKILNYPIVETEFEKGNVEFQYANNIGKNVVCFEVKGTSTKDLFALQHRTKKEHATPVKQTWDYMWNNDLKYGICTNYKDYILIDRNRGYSKYHFFDFTSIKNNEEKLKEFIAIFSKENLVQTNTIEELYNNSLIEERDFTKQFYKLFHETRLMLIKEFEDEFGISRRDAIHYTQLFLNRLIFMFFAEDNRIILDRLFTRKVFEILNTSLISEHTMKISDEIQNLFKSLDKGSKFLDIFGFNGGLFKENIPENLKIKDLMDSAYFTDVYQNSKLKKKPLGYDTDSQKLMKKYDDQLNPIIMNLLRMDSFDFNSELNINILGHIFEQSLADIEELKEEKISRRKKEGIYYTPDYVTEYICRNTIIPYLSKNNVTTVGELISEYSENIQELETKFKEIKILDPACGSGAFLSQAVDILLEIDKEIQNFKKTPEVLEQKGLTEWNEENEILKIIEENIFGVDINEESVEITKLSLFLKLATAKRKLIDLSKNIRVGNSLIDDSTFDEEKFFIWEKEFPSIVGKTGFNIIIGNPPYGAELSKMEQQYLNEKFAVGSSDTAQLMIKLSSELLSNDGFHGFIVPKSLTYASNWKKIRSLLLEKLVLLLDVRKVWKEVKLEQVIYVIKEGGTADSYLSGIRNFSVFDINTRIPKKLCTDFDFLLNGISKEEFTLGEKLATRSEKLGKYTENVRGAMIQKLVKDNGDTKVIGGQQVQRYAVIGEKGFVNRSKITDEKAFVSKENVLAQNIVAHIENPIDHVKITATVPQKDDFVILDTVNQIKPKKGISPYFIAGLLNSKLINWYTYRFIFAKAIRTMHFDRPATERIPIVIKKQDEIEKHVKNLMKLLSDLDDKNYKFLENVKRTFEISKTNKRIEEFYNFDFNDFLSQIRKNGAKKLAPKEEDEWMDYFNEMKEAISTLNSKISQTEDNINQLFYQIFGLTPEEIEIIDKSTPE